MKNTYLVYKDVTAEKKELVVATPQEWHSIMEENKRLPREQRRFFIKDCISDFDDIDCLYIETSREEYNRWHSRYEVSVQKRKCEKGYRMLSLDYFSDGDDNIPLQNVLASSEDIEKEVGSDMMMQELRRILPTESDIRYMPLILRNSGSWKNSLLLMNTTALKQMSRALRSMKCSRCGVNSSEGLKTPR